MALVSKELAAWKMEAGVTTPLMYRLRYPHKELIIYTSQPGWLIGKGGKLIGKYTTLLQAKLGNDFAVSMVETDQEII